MSYSALSAALPRLNASDRKFAESLIAGYRRYGSFSPRQMPYVTQLIARASAITTDNPNGPATSSVAVGNFQAVIDLFTTARKSLKYPKVRLLCGDTPIILSVAGERSSAPGTVNVTGEGSYPNRAWYGRVQPSGTWEPSRSVSPEMQTAQAALLSEFGRDPNTIAAAYGRATNTCCFCRAELTDARSVAAGYGPVCADHYGLKAEWTTAAAKSAGNVSSETPTPAQPVVAILEAQPSLFM